MSKAKETWHSQRLDRELTLVRWGEIGQPVLIFPTAGGDAEEIERFHLVSCVGEFLGAGLIKIYSVDSLAGRSWLSEDSSTTGGARIQNRFDAALYEEVLPAIRKDCNDPEIEVVTAGASLGAFNALAFLCRHPDAVKSALCMSGTYDLTKFLKGPIDDEYRRMSPIHFVPELADGSAQLATLRTRHVLLAHGEGRAESPEEDWKVERALGPRGVPNRVDSWGKDYPHDWVTWREMLPKYMTELVGEPTTAR